MSSAAMRHTMAKIPYDQEAGMSANEPKTLDKKVFDWLNKTGFPLEMRVARDMRAGLPDWYIDSNLVYDDPETGNLRECDLAASLGVDFFAEKGVSIRVELIVECKATQAPWVILRESFGNRNPRPLVVASSHTRNYRIEQRPDGLDLTAACSALDKFLSGRIPPSPAAGYAISEAFKQPNSRDAAYSAVHQVLSAMDYFARDYFNDDPRDRDRPIVALFLPVVVTSSPIYEASLDDASGEVEVRHVDRSAVSITRHVRRFPTDVSIVGIGAVSQLVADLAPLESEILEFLDTYDRELLRKT